MLEMRIRGGALIASTAVVDGDVVLEERANIWWNSVLRGDDARIVVGRETNIQDLVMVHADPGVPLVIGSHVTIGHHAVVHCARVGDRVLLGINCILLAGAEVGDDAIVAAGAVVTEGMKIPPRVVVAGVPARVIRDVRPEEIERSIPRAEKYWQEAQRRAGLLR